MCPDQTALRDQNNSSVTNTNNNKSSTVGGLMPNNNNSLLNTQESSSQNIVTSRRLYFTCPTILAMSNIETNKPANSNSTEPHNSVVTLNPACHLINPSTNKQHYSDNAARH